MSKTDHSGDALAVSVFHLSSPERAKRVAKALTSEIKARGIPGFPYVKCQEMVARIPQQDESVPYVKNGYRYQTRYEPGKEYAIYSRSKVEGDEAPSLLLDGNQRAEGHDFYSLGALEVSRNNRWLAVAEDFLSRRQYKIQFLDLESGKWAADVLENTSGNLVWANDSKTVFYVRKHPQTLLPYQVYRHELGTDPAKDQLV